MSDPVVRRVVEEYERMLVGKDELIARQQDAIGRLVEALGGCRCWVCRLLRSRAGLLPRDRLDPGTEKHGNADDQ